MVSMLPSALLRIALRSHSIYISFNVAEDTTWAINLLTTTYCKIVVYQTYVFLFI